MGNHVVRQDKTCLNCGEEVPEIYCTQCGQENVEVHKSFVSLFSHFLEDLTHYDSGFWKTIKYLLFRPARLTKLYLNGRRKAFVPPVKLYIFINFATFFLLSTFALSSNDTEADSPNSAEYTNRHEEKTTSGLVIGDYESVRQLDSVQAALPEKEKLTRLRYLMEHKFAEIHERTTPQQFSEQFGEAFLHTMPKVLFIYLPVFALMLWIFHGKKRWWYFDHAIFTLHYFSFLLLTLTFYVILFYFCNLISDDAGGFLGFTLLGMFVWWFFYFFRSHRNMYGESWAISIVKGLFLFVINVILIGFTLVAAMYYAVSNLK